MCAWSACTELTSSPSPAKEVKANISIVAERIAARRTNFVAPPWHWKICSSFMQTHSFGPNAARGRTRDCDVVRFDISFGVAVLRVRICKEHGEDGSSHSFRPDRIFCTKWSVSVTPRWTFVRSRRRGVIADDSVNGFGLSWTYFSGIVSSDYPPISTVSLKWIITNTQVNETREFCSES